MNHDPNLSRTQFTETVTNASLVFNEGRPIRELMENPVNLNGEEWDFEFHNGLRSLVRRGYYKIIERPYERDIIGVPTISAVVLYSPSRTTYIVFKFAANISPLVNKQAIGFDLTNSPNIISGNSVGYNNKLPFLIGMMNKVFYVSQQQYVLDRVKQTVWFKIQ
jgi:hypothetical protein